MLTAACSRGLFGRALPVRLIDGFGRVRVIGGLFIGFRIGQDGPRLAWRCGYGWGRSGWRVFGLTPGRDPQGAILSADFLARFGAAHMQFLQ